MGSDRKIKWEVLSPQLEVTVANDPQQIVTERKVFRTALIYNDRDNTGRILIADSAAKITAGNAIKLEPNEGWELHPDNFGWTDQFGDLREWYWSGDTIGDKLIIELIVWEEV